MPGVDSRAFLFRAITKSGLHEMEQAEAVWSGVHLGDCQVEQHNILLYQIDAFYV